MYTPAFSGQKIHFHHRYFFLPNLYLKINPSIEQVLDHGRVLVNGGHVKNILPIVLLADVDIIDQLGELGHHPLGQLHVQGRGDEETHMQPSLSHTPSHRQVPAAFSEHLRVYKTVLRAG